MWGCLQQLRSLRLRAGHLDQLVGCPRVVREQSVGCMCVLRGYEVPNHAVACVCRLLGLHSGWQHLDARGPFVCDPRGPPPCNCDGCACRRDWGQSVWRPVADRDPTTACGLISVGDHHGTSYQCAHCGPADCSCNANMSCFLSSLFDRRGGVWLISPDSRIGGSLTVMAREVGGWAEAHNNYFALSGTSSLLALTLLCTTLVYAG